MLDLQLDKVTEGSLICTIKVDGSPGSVYRVGSYSDLHGKYRLMSLSTNKPLGLLPPDGIGYYAMHPRDTPHFYYSANPLHVAKIQSTILAEQKRLQEKTQTDKAQLQELQKKINALLSDYNASLNVSLEGDTNGVTAELYLQIGSQCLVFEE